MAGTQGNAFITTRKGFCYLTIKIRRRNFQVMRIRNYTIDAEDKRDLRRRYPDVVFDWKKIGQQLAEKRNVCRRYRSRRRIASADRRPHRRHPSYAVYDPISRTVYVDDVPSTAGGVGSLLDAVLGFDRTFQNASLPAPGRRAKAKPRLELVKTGSHRKPRDTGQ